MFTSGYEMITSLTNVVIFILSIYFFFKVEDRTWKCFFYFLFLAGLIGSIIHGINLEYNIIRFLWVILSFVFCLVINILMIIFLKTKNKKILKISLLTIIVYSIFLTETILKIDFLLSFIIYACLCLIICLIMTIKNKYNKYILFGLLLQFIGGIFLLNKGFKIPFLFLDKNGIYHLFVLLTMLSFYKGIKNKPM